MKRLSNIILFFYLLLFPIYILPDLVTAQNRTAFVNVGVVLDQNELVGRMGLRCIRMAISEFYASRIGRGYKTRLVVHSRDSNSDVVGAASSALDLIKNVKVQAIIGPVRSTEAKFVVELGEKANVPIISFSATCPSLTARSSYFFRATGNEASQSEAIGSLVRAFGWKQVVPIYSSDAYGQGLVPFLIDTLLAAGAHVPYRSAVSPSASNKTIEKELRQLALKPIRVFVVQAYPSLGNRIFAEAKRLGMVREGFVWIVTSVMANLLTDSRDINGVLGIRNHVPTTKELEGFRERYRKKRFRDKEEVNVYGLWAYDAAKSLAMAVERVYNNLDSDKNELGLVKKRKGSHSNDLDSFGVSLSGLKLREALSDVKFKGLAGNFSLVRGELQVSAYEIINVVNNDINVVGFWTPEIGLTRDLNISFSETNKKNSDHYYSTPAKYNLSPITWPGGTKKDPKGWEIPINGNKLKVGVPLRGGFREFVNVEYNQDNTTNITGYCIDIFEAVINSLPYKVEYELIPFANSSHESNGTYDDMVYQVFLGNFDAVIGDVTIRSNRSLYVDFTLPYTGSGVSMIVTLKDKRNKNAWVFMKPLTWDLWVTSFCFFVFIGFVVWVHEHRINEDFRGPPSHQIGTSFWFSFSTMVFAHREKVFSNFSRFVIIIWVFVVVILTQSYTASLTSLLTVQQLLPNVTNVTQLIKNGDNVGYLEASFVKELLISLGFKATQLREYKSTEDLAKAFSDQMAGNQGIAAAFDEKPYMDVFLRMYCSKYTMIGPTFKTVGFGFAFPRGSPMVSGVSAAILNITEQGTLKQIETKWFGERKTCPNPSLQDTSNSLGLESFWGLFLIAGLSSLFALTIHMIIFFHGHWHIIKNSIPQEASAWERIRVVFRVLDQKDLTSHTFKNTVNTADRIQMSGEIRGGFGSYQNNVVVPIDATTNADTSQPVSPTSDSSRSV